LVCIMSPIWIAVAAFFLYLAAYHTYGRWLARRLFRLDASAAVPSMTERDDVDFVPTSRGIVFGHHFTSIAGTGPIVGPALAIMWGWLPALLWVLFGSILLGAVHDFGTLVVSLRNRGMTVGEIAGRVLNPRVRVLFLLLLFFALWVVLAIFGWVIASVFAQFPESILPVFLQIPIAIWIGVRVHRKGRNLFGPSALALGLMLATVWLGAGCPGLPGDGGALGQMVRNLNTDLKALPIWAWIAVLLAYCHVASVLPVWLLLQPRDYINSLQLVVSLGLVVAGLFVAAAFGVTPSSELSDGSVEDGRLALEMAAPAVNFSPLNAPPIFPFLFVTVACGAISGFHCLVSSGTSSKQLRCESDAQFVGYGSMLLEGFLAVMVILSVGAGLGFGWAAAHPGLAGRELWQTVYADWSGVTGGKAIGAFVVGSGNFLGALGIDPVMAKALMGVLVASFAGTTLDTATRLQRYVVQELAAGVMQLGRKPGASGASPAPGFHPLAWLRTKHGATFFAVGTAFVLAIFPGPGREWTMENIGTGGLILWPLFGATNQLLAGLALMVVGFWLRRRGLPTFVAAVPMCFMLVVPAWALWLDIGRWMNGGTWVLVAVAVIMLGLACWMVAEGLALWGRVKNLEASQAGVDQKDADLFKAETGS